LTRLFTNLTYSQAFLDFNFCDFFAEDAPGGQIGEVGEAYLSSQLKGPDSPEPYFWRILPTTLSPACCDTFLRHNRLPAMPRDYYLSKLHQFIYEAFRCVYSLVEPESEIRRSVHNLLDRIPDLALPPHRNPDDLATLFDAAYNYADRETIEQSIARLDVAVTDFVRPGSVARIKTGRRGRPALPRERKEAAHRAKMEGAPIQRQAALLYGVQFPSPRQVKDTPSILRYYEKNILRK
jgi:hypothetical protein